MRPDPSRCPAHVQILTAARSAFEAGAQRVRQTHLSGRRDMSLLLAQSAVQPGVASVYCAVVQQTTEGCEFYIKDFPQLYGAPYVEARRRFNNATLCATSSPAAHLPSPYMWLQA